MDIVQIVAVGIIGAVLALTLKKLSPELALCISIATCVVIFIMIMPVLGNGLTMIKNISALVDTDKSSINVVLRIIGIAYVSEFGAQACVDAGETSIASKIELSGKLLIIVASAPVLLDLIDLVLGIL